MRDIKYDKFDYVQKRVPRYTKVFNVVLFFDTVDFTRNSTNQQMSKIIDKIDTVIGDLLYDDFNWNEQDQYNDFILMPTGDGLGIAFHPDTDNDKILRIVIDLYTALTENNGISIRMGIAKGPNTRYLDVNKMNNLFGWGVNTAYRVMDGADKNQILIHEDYAKELRNIKEIKIMDKTPHTIETKHGETLTAFQLKPAKRK
jgi:class 3 adenylate cyclase